MLPETPGKSWSTIRLHGNCNSATSWICKCCREASLQNLFFCPTRYCLCTLKADRDMDKAICRKTEHALNKLPFFPFNRKLALHSRIPDSDVNKLEAFQNMQPHTSCKHHNTYQYHYQLTSGTVFLSFRWSFMCCTKYVIFPVLSYFKLDLCHRHRNDSFICSLQRT